MLGLCRKGDVSDDLFRFTIISNFPRIPISHGNTGNGNLVLTNGELIGIALAGYESSRGGGVLFCCFAFSICYFKREEGSGACGIIWIDKGIELIIAVLIRFHTTDAEAIDCSILRILVVEVSNLYHHSRHFALHGESKLIVVVFGIGLRTAKRHEVCVSKRF